MAAILMTSLLGPDVELRWANWFKLLYMTQILFWNRSPKIVTKGALSWYGKLTWESAHAWNLIILCLLIVWGMTFIFMVHLSFYAIPLLIYDVMYDITTIP